MVADEGGATLPFSFVTFLIGVDILLNQTTKDMGTAKDNITKKQQDKFVAGVTEGLLEMGAIKQPHNPNTFASTSFKLKTMAGNLNITLYHSQTFLFTVYSIFDEPEKAREMFDCNPHTGKFNFHRSSKNGDINDVIELAMIHFECTVDVKQLILHKLS